MRTPCPLGTTSFILDSAYSTNTPQLHSNPPLVYCGGGPDVRGSVSHRAKPCSGLMEEVTALGPEVVGGWVGGEEVFEVLGALL